MPTASMECTLQNIFVIITGYAPPQIRSKTQRPEKLPLRLIFIYIPNDFFIFIIYVGRQNIIVHVHLYVLVGNPLITDLLCTVAIIVMFSTSHNYVIYSSLV